ncbi:MAG: hypothetical protein GQ557_00550 [Mycoplasmataceae bacterium]|nr:hypothetical protein [Mycoplasmataceae bacterium]
MENYKFWLENAPEDIKKDLIKLSEEDIKFFFEKNIDFGTAGLRGKITWGTNAINEYTISLATFSFGKWLIDKYGKKAVKHGIVIAHDNRRYGSEYSLIAASILATFNIPVFLFPKNKPNPTPLLSFTIANNNFVGGINITASHNPPTDNGFKVYDQIGKQLSVGETKKIKQYSQEVSNIFQIEKIIDKEQYLSQRYIEDYIERIKKEIPFIKIPTQKQIKIMFVANNGTASEIAEKLLKFSKIKYEFVQEQKYPDPNFKYSPFPNPQDKQSFDLAKKYANKNGTDLIFATDPDADRFGLSIKHNDEWVELNGNELPLIQIYYKLNMLKERNLICKNDFIVRSIVTSSAADEVAKNFNVNVFESYTGFKNIIEVVEKQTKRRNHCLFAWEESYGSVVMPFTKDKDSFQALVQVIELVDFYKNQGKTLLDVLDQIYDEYGFSLSKHTVKRFDGIDGKKEMKKIVNDFRNNIKLGDNLNGHLVTEKRDYLSGYKKWPKDNILVFILDKKHRVTIRLSGTEPVLRFYLDISSENEKEAKQIEQDLLNKFVN